MRKFLYGKKEHLMPIVEGVRSPRFSDIAHYARLGNPAMRDDETTKTFIIDKSTVKLEVNGIEIPNHHIAADVEIGLPVRRCFCLCLSGKRNDPELFELFRADTCLEIDVDILMERLNSTLFHWLPGAHAVVKPVTYYDPYCFTPSLSPDELVFCKPKSFAHEDEFRVAIFFPSHRSAATSVDGKIVPLIDPEDPNHIIFSHSEKGFITDFVAGHYPPVG